MDDNDWLFPVHNPWERPMVECGKASVVWLIQTWTQVWLHSHFYWLRLRNQTPFTRTITDSSPFHTTKKNIDSLRWILRAQIVYLIIPWVTAFTSFHTTQSKKPTFYESTHIIISGHALCDMFIKNCHTQICADKNVVKVKTNYIKLYL